MYISFIFNYSCSVKEKLPNPNIQNGTYKHRGICASTHEVVRVRCVQSHWQSHIVGGTGHQGTTHADGILSLPTDWKSNVCSSMHSVYSKPTTWAQVSGTGRAQSAVRERRTGRVGFSRWWTNSGWSDGRRSLLPQLSLVLLRLAQNQHQLLLILAAQFLVRQRTNARQVINQGRVLPDVELPALALRVQPLSLQAVEQN
jgi:hypothetical protein